MMSPTGEPNAVEWVVRIQRRDNGRMYFFDKNGNINARRSSSMRLTKDDATQLAHAIAVGHKVYTARAMRYDSYAHFTPKEPA